MRHGQHYTILVVPENGRAVKKLVLPSGLVRWFPYLLPATAALAIFLFFAFVYSCYGFWTHRQTRRQVAQWRVTMEEVENHVRALEENLDRMSTMDSKLRMLSDLKDPDRQIALGSLPQEKSNYDSPFDEILTQLNMEGSVQNPDELLVKAKRLREQSLKEERSMAELTEQMRNQEILLAATPAIWPVAGHLTSRFGMRNSPITGQDRLHKGIDIGAPPGTTVYAPGDGTVVFVGSKSGYGQTLIINHGYGIITCYAHNSSLLVKNGERVRRGQAISKVGNTGASTGPHLHYEVRLHGVAKDPSLFILN